jgi:hypothetical protein
MNNMIYLEATLKLILERDGMEALEALVVTGTGKQTEDGVKYLVINLVQSK